MSKPIIAVIVFWVVLALVVTLLVLWPKVVAITLLVICALLVIPLISMLVYHMAKDALDD